MPKNTPKYPKTPHIVVDQIYQLSVSEGGGEVFSTAFRAVRLPAEFCNLLWENSPFPEENKIPHAFIDNQWINTEKLPITPHLLVRIPHEILSESRMKRINGFRGFEFEL